MKQKKNDRNSGGVHGDEKCTHAVPAGTQRLFCFGHGISDDHVISLGDGSHVRRHIKISAIQNLKHVKKGFMASNTYNAESIEVLSGLDPVRKRKLIGYFIML